MEFNKEEWDARALTVTRTQTDIGNGLYLVATKKGSIDLVEPVIVKVTWADFLELLWRNVKTVTECARNIVVRKP